MEENEKTGIEKGEFTVAKFNLMSEMSPASIGSEMKAHIIRPSCNDTSEN
jgi:hypothetical protein